MQSYLAVPVGAGVLIDRVLVPADPQPVETLEDGRYSLPGGSFPVGVLDAQQHFSVTGLGVEPVEQRRAGPADVQDAGWRRSKPGNDGRGHVMRCPVDNP